jgi:hypothetical protein
MCSVRSQIDAPSYCQPSVVIPAKAGTQYSAAIVVMADPACDMVSRHRKRPRLLGPRFRGDDNGGWGVCVQITKVFI